MRAAPRCAVAIIHTAMLRQELYERIKASSGGLSGDIKASSVIAVIKDRIKSDIPSDIIHEIEQQAHWFIVAMKKRWEDSTRNEERFLSKNKNWLNEPFSSRLQSLISTPPAPSSKRGRPALPFSAKKRESMRMATTDIATKNAAEKLLHAAKRRARSEGRRDLA